MAETSRFWNTNDVGDGAASGYATAAIGAWMQALFARGGSGILARVLNELAVSGSANPLAVASGCAIVDGLFYENTASLNLTVASPVVGTTGGRVVLEADWTAQTVRALVVLSADGTADIPALTETSGTTYQINLATFTITTGGVIGSLTLESGRALFANSPRAETLDLAAGSVLGNSANATGAGEDIAAASDGQVLRRSGTDLEFGQIVAAGLADNAVTAAKLSPDLEAATAQLADGAADAAQLASYAVDDTKAGDRTPQFYRRQGSSSTDWTLPGATDYTPARVRMLAGVVEVVISSGYGAVVNVTLPVALSNPILLCGVMYRSGGDPATVYAALATIVNSTTIKITGKRHQYINETVTLNVAWMAIGPTA